MALQGLILANMYFVIVLHTFSQSRMYRTDQLMTHLPQMDNIAVHQYIEDLLQLGALPSIEASQVVIIKFKTEFGYSKSFNEPCAVDPCGVPSAKRMTGWYTPKDSVNHFQCDALTFADQKVFQNSLTHPSTEVINNSDAKVTS